jgi:branched-chain amino acid aminotransferase
LCLFTANAPRDVAAMAPPPSGPLADIDSKQLQVQRTRRPLPKCPDEQLGFGKVITDHMLKVQWRSGKGWAAPQIVPSGPVGLHPFAHVFHYAIECYEGMKAYVDDEGETRLFRPDMNMKRFNDSAARLCLPAFDGDELLECIKELLRVDKEWIPHKRGYSMYLRPVIFSTTPWLGLTQCSEAMILVLMSPVGPYFKSGFVPIKLAVDAKYIRAWPGGTGDIKYGGNYGSTVISQKEAASGGASQSLYVYDVDEFITEAGTMNVFFLWTNTEGVKELVTPTLEDGTILPGVTRRSVLDLAGGVERVRRHRKAPALPRGGGGVREERDSRGVRHRDGGGDPAHRLHQVPGKDVRGAPERVRAGVVPAAFDQRTVRDPVREDPAPVVCRGVSCKTP